MRNKKKKTSKLEAQEVVYPCNLELLIKKLIPNQPSTSQRENLFQTRCNNFNMS